MSIKTRKLEPNSSVLVKPSSGEELRLSPINLHKLTLNSRNLSIKPSMTTPHSTKKFISNRKLIGSNKEFARKKAQNDREKEKASLLDRLKVRLEK